MLYIVFTTAGCNLDCGYCGGSMPESMMPKHVGYDLEALGGLVARDDDAVVAFYGGEPLLRMDRMKDMMAALPAKRFVLQTNGTLLHRLPQACVDRLDTILVSLDGRPELTDANRAPGLHHRVMANVRAVRPRFKGDLVARMTVTEGTRIDEDVLHLLDEGFDHVHWQLNALWSPDGAWADMAAWARNEYGPALTRLNQLWLDAMKEGRVLGIVPFLGVLDRLRTGATGLPCGAGRDSFAITTDGRVLACPIGPEYAWNRVSALGEATPETIHGAVAVEEPCRSCDVAGPCGGRCLFANRERALDPQGFETVCGTVRHLVREMERARPHVEALIENGVVDAGAFAYPPFNNTTEIIP